MTYQHDSVLKCWPAAQCDRVDYTVYCPFSCTCLSAYNNLCKQIVTIWLTSMTLCWSVGHRHNESVLGRHIDTVDDPRACDLDNGTARLCLDTDTDSCRRHRCVCHCHIGQVVSYRHIDKISETLCSIPPMRSFQTCEHQRRGGRCAEPEKHSETDYRIMSPGLW